MWEEFPSNTFDLTLVCFAYQEEVKEGMSDVSIVDCNVAILSTGAECFVVTILGPVEQRFRVGLSSNESVGPNLTLDLGWQECEVRKGIHGCIAGTRLTQRAVAPLIFTSS